MAPGLNGAAALARQQHWQIIVIMGVAVPYAAPIRYDAVVQQRPLAFFDRVELLEEVGELADVKTVNPGNLLLLGLVVPVVRKMMMPCGNLDDRCRPLTSI